MRAPPSHAAFLLRFSAQIKRLLRVPLARSWFAGTGRRGLTMNSKISYAVAAILSAASVAAAAAEPAASTTEGGSEALQEVTVTAQRRSENMQDVPISMQAFTAETLQQLNIQTFDDYLRYIPSVTSASNGPGQSEIFMRGLSAGSQPSQGSASTGAVAQCRDLPGQPVWTAAESQPRYLCCRSRSYRGSRGPPGDALRSRSRGRPDPLHHQPAEAEHIRGQRQGWLRNHGSR